MSPVVPRNLSWLLLAAILALGIWLRVPTDRARARLGADEGYYMTYVDELKEIGVLAWPTLVSRYIEKQAKRETAYLPPTRVLFLGSASVIQSVSGTKSVEAVRWVSFAAGIGILLASAGIAFRWGGLSWSVGVSALVACSPLSIHLSHRALIDGFFAFWALIAVGALWEFLQKRDHRWLVVFGVGIAAMVLTKENAAFVFVALAAILLLAPRFGFGRPGIELWMVMFGAAGVAAVILMVCAGGPGPLITAYRLNVAKSVVLPYAIATGDGPWHRYLLDFLLVNPVITVLAIAAMGSSLRGNATARYFTAFIVTTYLLMAQVRYGMNVRYAAMWDPILCSLALLALTTFANQVTAKLRIFLVPAAIALVCLAELASYRALFVKGNVYDPVAGSVTQPLKMYQPR